MKAIKVIFLLLLLASCKAPAPVTQVPIETRTTVTERLVPVPVPADSAVLEALFECDSNYNVLLKSFNEIKSQRMESNLGFSDGKLSYEAKKPADSVQTFERTIEIEKEVPVEVPVPYEVNVLTGWQWFQIWCGRIFGGLFLLVAVFKTVKKWK